MNEKKLRSSFSIRSGSPVIYGSSPQFLGHHVGGAYCSTPSHLVKPEKLPSLEPYPCSRTKIIFFYSSASTRKIPHERARSVCEECHFTRKFRSGANKKGPRAVAAPSALFFLTPTVLAVKIKRALTTISTTVIIGEVRAYFWHLLYSQTGALSYTSELSFTFFIFAS